MCLIPPWVAWMHSKRPWHNKWSNYRKESIKTRERLINMPHLARLLEQPEKIKSF